MRRLHDIFKDQAEGRDFNNPQTVDYILPRMGLTLALPGHPDALFSSCHKHAALALREMMECDNINAFESDHIKIRLLGRPMTAEKVFHTIVVDTSQEPEKVIIDSLGAEDSHHSYYDDNGDYRIKTDPRADTHESLELMHEISIPDFREKYIDPIVQGHTPAAPGQQK